MKRVLIVSYYWPPAGGPGVQRWLKFAKYLPGFGVEPILYVPENPHYPLKDPSLEQEIPPDLQVIRRPIFEPYSLAGLVAPESTQKISSGIIPEEKKQGFLQKLLLFVRGNFFIPDARKFWVAPSVEFLAKYLEENQVDTLITTGPPHSMHLIGLHLKSRMDLKWIADFRDPWTTIGYHEKLRLLGRARRRHKKLEREVLQQADQLVTTSYTTCNDFQEITSRPVTVITNGYDKEKIGPVPLDAGFSIAHIGSLLSGRDPRSLWRALRELVEEDPAFAADFQLKLVGAVGESVLASISEAGLEEWVRLKGYVSHQEALKLQRSSQLLLLIEIDSEQTRGIIPGKLFEYMQSQRPILGIGPEQADIQRILQETNTGGYFLYSEKQKIKEYLKDCYRQYQQGQLRSHPIGLQKYSRQQLTGALAQLINQV